jgi:hypothetical protein
MLSPGFELMSLVKPTLFYTPVPLGLEPSYLILKSKPYYNKHLFCPGMSFFVFPRRFLLREKINECRRELPTPWRDLRVHTSIICVHTSMPRCAYMFVSQR